MRTETNQKLPLENPSQEQAWEEFHEFINQAEIAIGGKGLFLDIHGHGHPVNWAELGYLI